MPSTAVLLSQKPLYARALTVSGNEQADLFGVSRFTNTQGDGLTFPNKSVGSWAAATNLCINGNATTNTTGITEHSSTTTRVTAGTVKFGSTAFNVVSSNLAANEGPDQAISTGASSTQYSVSAWVWLVSGAATVRATLSDTVGGKHGGTPLVLTATPQRVTVTATTGAASGAFASYIETTAQQVGTWRIGGWQVEANNFATPYVQTDGATATRAITRIQIPVTRAFNKTQGWVVIKSTPRYSAGANAPTFPVFFSWRLDNNNHYTVYYRNASTRVDFDHVNAAAVDTASSGAYSPVSGTAVCVAAAWTATVNKVSVAGAAFVSHTLVSGIPAITTTTMELGEDQLGDLPLAGEIQWVVTGDGVLSDADAAWFNKVSTTGNGVPDLYGSPGHATMVWDARNAIAVARSS